MRHFSDVDRSSVRVDKEVAGTAGVLTIAT